MSLFAELKRRNVVRVALAYGVIGWAIAQIAEFALETFGAPAWVLKVVVLLLLLGLPVVVIFAWAFELTPEGIKREKDVDRSQSITSETGRKIDYVIVGGLALVAVLVLARPYLPGAQPDAPQQAPESTAESSVAVLPFIDLSQSGDQEYFADGISEEILNVLVRIPGLKVAGRTSSFSFKGRNEDLREIGATLGVNHILEGSIRRSGSQLRITAQLIRGEDGFHLWSETYDRELSDIFEIQDDIARSVADQLAVSLGLPNESLVRQRTGDLVAYENYLRAYQLYLQRGKDNLDKALLLLAEAVARDPGYAPAWSAVANIYALYPSYETSRVHYDHWLAIGQASARQAARLDPENGSAYAALGHYAISERDFDAALDNFDRAIALAEDEPDVLDSVAQGLLDMGYYQRAVGLSQRAIRLDPLVAMFRNTLGMGNEHLGRYDEAERHFKEANSLDPTLAFPYHNLVIFAATADQKSRFESLVKAAHASGAWDDDEVDMLLAVIAAWDDPAALRHLYSGADSATKYLVAIILDEPDLVVEMVATKWEQEHRPVPNLTNNVEMDFVVNHPRWKEQIRRDGLLGFWRERGFPSWCRPVGEDDFECSVPDRPPPMIN